MARTEYTHDVDGKECRFGCNSVTKKIDVPEDIDAHSLIQAIALQFANSSPEDYPLGNCLNIDSEKRHFDLAPGWSMTAANKNRIKKVQFG